MVYEQGLRKAATTKIKVLIANDFYTSAAEKYPQTYPQKPAGPLKIARAMLCREAEPLAGYARSSA